MLHGIRQENPQFEYGHSVTSHSSQCQTADRVLVYADMEQVGEKLVNRQLVDAAVSRGRYDAQVYMNDKTHLSEQLTREVSHRSAMEQGRLQQLISLQNGGKLSSSARLSIPWPKGWVHLT